MKYKEGDIPAEMMVVNASNDMLLFTATIGLVIGLVLFFLGRTGNQMWMWTWGIGLMLCSVYLWASLKLNFMPFGYF